MKLDDKKKEIAGKMKPICADRSCKDQSHKHSWMGHHEKGKWKQKGKESLNIPRGEKNEGNKMMEGKNENNRQ
jgi:hypothetical protein